MLVPVYKRETGIKRDLITMSSDHVVNVPPIIPHMQRLNTPTDEDSGEIGSASIFT